jgi:glycosyltransferase involved in cell wall biosynthesis
VAEALTVGLYLEHFPAPGGTTNSVRGLANALADQKDVDVVVLTSRHSDEEPATSHPVRLRRIDVPRWPRGLAGRISDLELRDLSLIVLNGMFHRHLPAVGRRCARLGLPYVVALQGVPAPAFFARNRHRKRAYLHVVERPLLERAAAVQLLSPEHETHLRAIGITTRCFVVPNAVSVQDDVAARAQRRDTYTLGYLGRIDAWCKGLDLLVEALSIARVHLPFARLVLRGVDTGDGSRLEALATRLGIAGAVVFEPAEWSRPAELMRDWDVVVLPSRFDGFGLAAAEAMAAGLPVLVSTETGIAPHVRKAGCGLVVPPTPQGIAEAIVELARDDRRALGLRGRAYASAHLTWAAAATQAATSYRRVVEEAAA